MNFNKSETRKLQDKVPIHQVAVFFLCPQHKFMTLSMSTTKSAKLVQK